ncbi:hypothetical protein F4782DRAFT_486694 [Xylaria castorea]|nr:hypothetical protein F4782DRAFT_486694 [Xylaria castorea]
MRRTLLRLAPSSLPNTYVQTQPSYRLANKRVLWNDPTAENDPTIEINPGQHVASVSRQYKIASPHKLKSPKGFKLKRNRYQLSVLTCQQHCFAHTSMRYLDKLEHPLTKSLLDVYIEKKKEPLWISCSAYGPGVFPNKIAQKKIAHALRDALAAAGYDRFGRRVLVDGESSAIADLHGTLRVTCGLSTTVCNAKFADLLEYAKTIIAGVETEFHKRDAFAGLTKKRDGQTSPLVQMLQHQQRQPTHSAWQSQRREPNNQRRRRTNYDSH